MENVNWKYFRLVEEFLDVLCYSDDTHKFDFGDVSRYVMPRLCDTVENAENLDKNLEQEIYKIDFALQSFYKSGAIRKNAEIMCETENCGMYIVKKDEDFQWDNSYKCGKCYKDTTPIEKTKSKVYAKYILTPEYVYHVRIFSKMRNYGVSATLVEVITDGALEN